MAVICGVRTRLPSGVQSPGVPSPATGRICSFPKADWPKALSGSSVAMAVRPSCRMRSLSASESVVCTAPSAVATSTFPSRGKSASVCTTKLSLLFRGISSLPAKVTGSAPWACPGVTLKERSLRLGRAASMEIFTSIVRPSFSLTVASEPSLGEVPAVAWRVSCVSLLPSPAGVNVCWAIPTSATLPKPRPMRIAWLSPAWIFRDSTWISPL